MACLIFDCDGVLVESEAIAVEAELAFLSARGVRVERSDYLRQFMGTTKAEWIAAINRLLIDATGRAPASEEIRELVERIHRDIVETVEPVQGARDLLARLAGPMCVASSSGLEVLHAKLRRTQLDGYFGDGVFSAEQVGRGKPAPDLFLHVAASMRVPAADCVVIEDSSNGVVSGKRAGMTVVGLVAATHCPPGHGKVLEAHGADFVAGSYEQLGAWLNENRWAPDA